jgi:hypothetical protein
LDVERQLHSAVTIQVMSDESKLRANEGADNLNALADEVNAIEASFADGNDASPEPSTSSSSSKKKKKNKVSKIKSALTPGSSKQAEEVYNAVKKQVEKTAGPEEANKLTPEAVAEIIRVTSMREYLQGKTGLMGKNKTCVSLCSSPRPGCLDTERASSRDMADFKFWSTQPVVKLGSGNPVGIITPMGLC